MSAGAAPCCGGAMAHLQDCFKRSAEAAACPVLAKLVMPSSLCRPHAGCMFDNYRTCVIVVTCFG
jgi:hypothetical protein